MLFPSNELVARIERAEARLIREGIEAACSNRELADSFCVELGEGVAGYGEAGSPLNKVAGLGFDGELPEDALERVEEMYREARCPVQVELSTSATPSIGALLTTRGYVLSGFENAVGVELAQGVSASSRSGIDVEQVEGDIGEWLRVVVDGFLTPDAQGVPSHERFPREILERIIGDMASCTSMRRYLARIDGEPVGGASVRFDEEGVAQFCGASTLAGYRGRGVQSALIGARLAEARARDCSIALTTVQPGSKSMENMMRFGFGLLYARAILVREWVSGSS